MLPEEHRTTYTQSLHRAQGIHNSNLAKLWSSNIKKQRKELQRLEYYVCEFCIVYSAPPLVLYSYGKGRYSSAVALIEKDIMWHVRNRSS